VVKAGGGATDQCKQRGPGKSGGKCENGLKGNTSIEKIEGHAYVSVRGKGGEGEGRGRWMGEKKRKEGGGGGGGGWGGRRG